MTLTTRQLQLVQLALMIAVPVLKLPELMTFARQVRIELELRAIDEMEVIAYRRELTEVESRTEMARVFFSGRRGS